MGLNISFKQRSNNSNSRRGFNSYSNAQFKNSGNQNSNLLQRNSTTNTTKGVAISTSVDKKIVLQFKDSSSTTGREISSRPGKLGKTEKRSEYFADSQGISNSIPLQTKTKKGTKRNKLFNAREGNNLIRSGKYLEEGCCGTSLFTKRPISEQYIYIGWGQQTCDQLEGVKPIYPFLTFQNGEFTVAENSLAKKTVHVQTRPQERIFMCPTFSGRSKESDVSIRTNPVPVSMPLLWPCNSPIYFHKTP